MSDAASTNKIPDHVPPELVFRDGPRQAMGGQADPDALRDPFTGWKKYDNAPGDLFYVPGEGDNAGHWIVRSAELVREVLQQADPFSSSMAGGGGAMWPRRLIPLELDPPEHIQYRRLIAGLFSPKAIDKMEARVLEVTTNLIDKFIDKGECDFVKEFARPLPVTIFMDIMGLPQEQQAQFVTWEHTMFQGTDNQERMEAGLGVATYLAELIAERVKEPKDDLVSALAQTKVDGKPIPQENLEDMCFLLFLAGLDTVTAGLGHSFRFLAENPGHRDQLIKDPDLIPGAVEEMLRLHAWINIGRTLSRDAEFHGVQMKKGERVGCQVFNASHDPKEFDRPDEVDFTREPNPHFAFAAGVHRCAGSHLARREMRVAVREVTRRIPNFEIKEGAELLYNGGLVGLGSLPLVWKV